MALQASILTVFAWRQATQLYMNTPDYRFTQICSGFRVSPPRRFAPSTVPFRGGIRTLRKCEHNKNKDLSAKSVSCQRLLLRHLTPRQISLSENRASKIPSICGTLWGKLLTAEMAEKPISVSLCPTFSEAPDCPGKVRR